MRPWVVVVAAVAAVALGYGLRKWIGEPAVDPVAGGVAGVGFELEFELESLAGKTVTAADYRGRVVVIDFWATWCGPCREQEAILADLVPEYDAAEVAFLAINVGESPRRVADFVRADPFASPVLLDPAQTLGARYGIYALPTVLVADADGAVTFSRMGITPAETVRRAIAEASPARAERTAAR